MKWQGILAVIGTVFLLVWLVNLLFNENKDYFKPKVQVSDCALDGETFVEVLCKEEGIDPNSSFRIECPKCPSGNWYNSIPYDEVDFGAYVQRNSDGSTEMCLFYGVSTDELTGTFCSQCGYQIGTDWKIIDLNEGITMTSLPSLIDGERYVIDANGVKIVLEDGQEFIVTENGTRLIAK